MLKIEHATEHVVLLASGEIDAATEPALEQAGSALLAAHDATDLVIDFSAVTFCDSACLRLLLKLRDIAQSTGGSVRVRGATGIVARVFEVTGLGEIFGVRPAG